MQEYIYMMKNIINIHVYVNTFINKYNHLHVLIYFATVNQVK